MSLRMITLLIGCSTFLGSISHAQFDLNFDFVDGTPQQQAELQPVLDEAKVFWESNLAGYQPGVRLSGVDIEVTLTLVVGANALGGHLLSGGSVNQLAGFSFYTNAMQSRSVGVLALNPDFAGNPLLQIAANHEIGHILGFASLWDANDLYVLDSGEYTGSAGLAAYQDEFDNAATFVPIELNPGAGANFHLPETDTITDSFGRPIAHALMTGLVEPDPNDTFFSETGRAMFVDLGYRLKEETLLGDVNCDGQVDLLDVQPFINLLTSGEFSDKADMNLDGAVDLLDVQPFVSALTGG